MGTEDSNILSPDQVQEIRKSRREKKVEHVSDKYCMRGSRVSINYESQGRFSIPENMYFKDYDIEDVNNLTFSKQEDLLENVLFILNKCKNEDANCSVGDMVPEEFLETLIGMKLQFANGIEHSHPWLCECQNGKPQSEQTVNETVIDLSKLIYLPIAGADKLLKDYYKEMFDSFTPEEWLAYLNVRYKEEPFDFALHTKEAELETITIKEPISQKINDKIYAFRLMRMNDVIKGQRASTKKFNGQIKTIESKKVPTPELKMQRDEELVKAEREKDKYSILYSQAMTLLSVDDVAFTSDEERFLAYKSIPRSDLFDLIDFYDEFKFGVNQEIELSCPLCGKTVKRSLRQEINSIELLPLESDTKRTSRSIKTNKIFIGL